VDFVTIEDRVDRLEALFGQFMTEMAVLNKRADEREKRADERERVAEERHKAAEERNQKAEERFARFEQEMADINLRSDQRNQAADQRFARFEQEMADINLRSDQRNQAADQRFARFEQEMAEFKAEMRADRKEMNRQWGALSNKLGHIVEDIMGPNLPRLARDHFGLAQVDEILLRVSRRNPQNKAQWGEFDAIVSGPGMVLLGEAKTTPSIQYAEAFAAKLKVFSTFFPHYSGLKLIGVFASWSVPAEVEDRLTALGIYCLQMGEETMDLTNADKLEP